MNRAQRRAALAHRGNRRSDEGELLLLTRSIIVARMADPDELGDVAVVVRVAPGIDNAAAAAALRQGAAALEAGR